MKRYIPVSRVEGTASRQAHCDLPDGTYEREMSKDGFFGPAAFFHHRHPPTGWTDFSGPLQPRAYDLSKLASSATSPWSATEVLANAHCRIRYWRLDAGMARLARNADGDELLFVHAGRWSPVLRLRAPRDRAGRLRGPAPRHDVANRLRGPARGAAGRGDQLELHASRQGHGRQSRDLRSGNARHAQDRCRVPGPAERLDALAGRSEATQPGVADHLSVQSARRRRLARRALGGPHQRPRHPAADEPSLPPAAVGAHDFRVQSLRRLHLCATTVRDRPRRAQGAVLPQQRRLRRGALLPRRRLLQPRQHPPGHDDAAPGRLHPRAAPEGAEADVQAGESRRRTSTP